MQLAPQPFTLLSIALLTAIDVGPAGAQSKAVGRIPGALEVSASGGSRYAIQIDVPSGTSGTTPRLALVYDSYAPSGALGAGWAIDGMSVITRGPRTHYHDGRSEGIRLSDDDALFLDGQRLVPVRTTGAGESRRVEYRKEVDDLTRVVETGAGHASAVFDVQTKGGVRLRFDGSNGSTVRTEDGTVLLWCVSRIADTPGNFIEFEYLQNGAGDYAVRSVRYTGYEKRSNAGVVLDSESAYASIDFDYEPAPRTIEMYIAGRLIRKSYRLRAITSHIAASRSSNPASPSKVGSKFALEYEERPTANRSVLSRIRRIGSDNTELEPSDFVYSSAQVEWRRAPFQFPAAFLASDEELSGGYRVGHLDGATSESRDILFAAMIGGRLESFALTSVGSVWTRSDTWKPPVPFIAADGSDLGVKVLDLNGDGFSDLLRATQEQGKSVEASAFLRTPTGWQSSPQFALPFPLSSDGKPNSSYVIAHFSDSSRPDVVYEFGAQRGLLKNTATGWQSDPIHAPPISISAQTFAFDVDCDGRPELLSPVNGAWRTYKFDPMDSWSTMASEFDLPISSQVPLTAIVSEDLNGDGCRDLLVASAPHAVHRALLARSAGWSDDPFRVPPFDLLDTDGATSGVVRLSISGVGRAFVAHKVRKDGTILRFAFALGATGWQDLGDAFSAPRLVDLELGVAERIVLVADWDADGNEDLAIPGGGRGRFGQMFTSAPTGLTARPEYVPPVAFSRQDRQDAGVRFVDLNADGLADVVFRRDASAGGKPRVTSGAFINTGNGWRAAPKFAPPQPLAGDSITGTPEIFADVDGDGYIDMLYSYRRADGTVVRAYYRNQRELDGSRAWVEQVGSQLTPPAGFPFAIQRMGDAGARAEDLNGDGRIDLLFSAVEAASPGAGPVETCSTVDGTTSCTLNREIFDGAAMLNDGARWTISAAFKPPLPFVGRPAREQDLGSDLSVAVVDIDGDRLPDIVARFRHPQDSTKEVNEVWLNSGRGWQLSSIKAPIALDTIARNSRLLVQWLDVNGDGLADVVTSGRQGGQVLSMTWLSTGKGFVPSAKWAVPIDAIADRDGDQGFRITDIDGDGYPDLIYARMRADGQVDRGALRNDGTAWVAAPASYSAGMPAIIDDESRDLGVRLADVDGNGLPDLIRAYNRSNDLAVERDVLLNSGRRTELLTRVSTGYGLSTDIEYRTLLESAVPSTNTAASPWPRAYQTTTRSMNASFPFVASIPAAYVVTQTTQPSSSGVVRQFFRYGDFLMHVTGTRSLGFGWRETYSEASRLLVRAEYDQSIELAGRTTRESTCSLKSAERQVPASVPDDLCPIGAPDSIPWSPKLAEVSYSWRTVKPSHVIGTPPAGLRQVQLANTTSDSYEIDGTLVSRETTTLVYDSSSNYLDLHQNLIESTTTRLDGSSVTTTNSYDQDTFELWLLGRITRSVVEKEGDPDSNAPNLRVTERRVTEFTYDPGTGLLASSTTEPGHPQSITTTYSRDKYGNVTGTRLDAANEQSRIATATFDVLGRQIVEERNTLQHAVRFERDLVTGAVRVVTDPNNLQTRYDYDGFGRITAEILPTGARKTLDRVPVSAVDGTHLSGILAAYAEVARTGTLAPVIRLYDQNDRLVRDVTDGFTLLDTEHRWIYTDRLYDALGRTTHESLPYEAGGPRSWRVSEFDALGRITRTKQPDGTSLSVHYSGRTGGGRVVVNTDQMGRVTTVETNTRGLPLAVIDNMKGRVTYGYDAGDRLTQMRGASGAVTRIAYDLFGRRELLRDPDMGATTYSFNAFGDLMKQTDARGQVIGFQVDGLGRTTLKTLPDGTVLQWTYDVGARAIGRPSNVRDPNTHERQFTYDQYGRLESTITKIGNEGFATSVEYDALGRLTRTRYPVPPGASPVVIDNWYDAKGFLIRVTGGNGAPMYWQALEYDVVGRVTREQYGNGVETIHKFNSLSGRPERILAQEAGGRAASILDLSLKYDDGGSLRTRREANSGRVETFEYDFLDRLRSSTVGTAAKATFEYLTDGRIRRLDGVGQFRYHSDDQAGPWQPYHAVLGVRRPNGKEEVFRYDDNGNRLTSGDRTLSYTSDNRLREVKSDPTHWTRLYYGPLGEAFRRMSVDGTKALELTSVGSFERVREFTQGDTTSPARTRFRVFIANGEGAFALLETVINRSVDGQTTSAGVRPWYLHRDQLGSVLRVTDSKGRIAARYWYDSWGRQVQAVLVGAGGDLGPLWRGGFTGHDLLGGATLVDMGGRVYDPGTGMFVSADPVSLVTGYTQTLGRFTYALNNPLKYTDPTGLWPSIGGILGAIGGFIIGGPIGAGIGFLAGDDGTRRWVQENWKEIVVVTAAVAVTVATGGAGCALSCAILSGMAAGAASGATRAALYGGDFGDILVSALKGAAIGGASAGVFYGVGEAFSGTAGSIGSPDSFGAFAAHGLAGGGMNAAEGGNFWQGFLSGAIRKAGSDWGPEFGVPAEGVVRAALVGGAVAEVTGGKFANGAIIGAYSYAFNDALHEASNNREVILRDSERGMQCACGDEASARAAYIESIDPPIQPTLSPLDLLVGGATFFASRFALAGGELAVAGMRFAPFGNRTGNSLGRLPHYHRRTVDPVSGETIPGQGIGRHRPWETKSTDKSFWDRWE